MKCPECDNPNLRQVTEWDSGNDWLYPSCGAEWATKGIFEGVSKPCDLKDLKDCEGGC